MSDFDDQEQIKLQILKAELELKKLELEGGSWRRLLSSPLTVAMSGAALAIAGSVILSFVESSQQLEQSSVKLQSDLVLEAIKTSDPDSAAENLNFLVAANLISSSTLEHGLRTYLSERENGSGAAISSVSAPVPGPDFFSQPLPRRPDVFDADGGLIASSEIAHRVYVSPKEIVDMKAFLELMSAHFSTKLESVTKMLNNGRKFFWLTNSATEHQFSAIRQYNLAGIELSPYNGRTYVDAPAYSSILGSIGLGNKSVRGSKQLGQNGVEQYVDTEICINSVPGGTAAAFDCEVRAISLTVAKRRQEKFNEFLTEDGVPSAAMLIVTSDGVSKIRALSSYPRSSPYDTTRSLNLATNVQLEIDFDHPDWISAHDNFRRFWESPRPDIIGFPEVQSNFESVSPQRKSATASLIRFAHFYQYLKNGGRFTPLTVIEAVDGFPIYQPNLNVSKVRGLLTPIDGGRHITARLNLTGDVVNIGFGGYSSDEYDFLFVYLRAGDLDKETFMEKFRTLAKY